MWLLAAFPLLLAGCGSGGGGGSGAAVAPPPVSVEALVVTPALSGSTLRFQVISPRDQRVTLDIEVSEDRGISYRPATVEGETRALEASADGDAYSLTWFPAADLELVDQSDLRIRITPHNASTGDVGLAATSDVFGLGDNDPPVVHDVTGPPGLVGGEIPLEYTISDANHDVVGIRLEYSVGGVTWHAGTAALGGHGTDAVTSQTSPVTRVVHWNAQVDLPGVVANDVFVRVIPEDIAVGTSAESGAIDVNLIAPVVDLLTIGAVPETMNGSAEFLDYQGDPVAFRLAVPPSGFTLTLECASGPGGGALDAGTLQIAANRPLGSRPAHANLADEFSLSSGSGAWTVDGAIGPGPVIFRASIRDEFGNVSVTSELVLDVVSGHPGSRPFSAPDVWWLDFESDMFTTTFTGGSTVDVQIESVSNGVADFEEDLLVLGLRTENPTVGSAAMNTNSRLRTWIVEETRGRLNELFGGDFDGTEPGYHSNLTFSLTPTGTRSSIRVGGDDLGSGFTLGRAQFDYRNAGGNHNRTATLGVFTTNMIQFYVNTSFSFRNRFDPLIPGRGTPAGEGPLDHIVLGETFDRLDPGNDPSENDRYDEITAAIDGIARSTAVVLAHEIGHSIGLCANDPPPLGLFGGTTEPSFAGPYTTPYHFDSPGNNIMAASLSFSTSMIATSTGYRFNELNEAYLREWIILE